MPLPVRGVKIAPAPQEPAAGQPASSRPAKLPPGLEKLAESRRNMTDAFGSCCGVPVKLCLNGTVAKLNKSASLQLAE